MKRLLVLLLLPLQAYAADFFYGLTAGATVNCQTTGIGPGDTITLGGGTRTVRLLVRDCYGTSADPIVIRNDSSSGQRVTFVNDGAASGGYNSAALTIRASDHVHIDASGGWEGMPAGAWCGEQDGAPSISGCGFVIIPGPNYRPVRYISIQNMVDNASRPEDYPGQRGIRVKGVGVQAAANYGVNTGARAGLYCHTLVDHLTLTPGAWREDFVIEGNYFSDIWGEPIYCGNNFGECRGGACIPNRNMTVRNNASERSGRDGVNPKLWVEGNNTIAENYVADAGLRNETTQMSCLQVGNTVADIWGNTLVRCGSEGINVNPRADMGTAGPYVMDFYNNVIVEPGQRETDLERRSGIRVLAGGGAPDTTVSAYNNTIVSPLGDGINYISVTDGVVRNNIMAGIPGGYDAFVETTPDGAATVDDNIVGTVIAMMFDSAVTGSYRLTDTSPALETATDAPFADEDFLGVERPQGDEADAGAFEYVYLAPAAPQSYRQIRGLIR